MPRPFDTARLLLAEGLYEIEKTDVNQVWWPMVVAFMDDIRRDPILGPIVRELGEAGVVGLLAFTGTKRNTFWSAGDPPLGVDEWGRQAWNTLNYLSSMVPGEAAKLHSPVGGSVITEAMKGGRDHRPTALQGYVRPMVRWLRREVARGAVMQASIDRWIRRYEWTGPRGAALAKVKEAHMQMDLHRYLFDQGIDFRDQGREHFSARGRVDFLLRQDVPVAVELKVWRDRDSMSALHKWFHQAWSYPSDFSISTAYLVILCASKANRLQLGEDLGQPAVLEHSGVQVHIRLCDPARRAASKDAARKRVLVNRTALLGQAA